MPLAFLDELRYYTDYGFYQKHFKWRHRFPRLKKLRYHCFWSGPVSRYHELCLKSLLITQSPPFEVLFWLPPESIASGGLALEALRTLPHVSIRSYVPQNEATGTAFAAHPELLNADDAVTMSDAFRLLILQKYGGIYFDMDILFLKDLRRLAGVEFFWQWSNQPYGSNAVMHFRKGSINAQALARRAVRLSTCRPGRLLHLLESQAWPGRVCVFPSFVFSPVWIAHDIGRAINDYCNHMDDFFEASTKVSLRRFFPDAYAYHWHNGWSRPIDPRTIVGQLWKEVDQRFHRRFR